MTPFDPIQTPLRGISLIEAAAGTGKTYAIESLYIRLVLEKQLPVEQILVVTFTRAATAELRYRIYKRLARVRDAFAGTPVESDPLLDHLLDLYPQRSVADRLLRQALMDFDRAGIFTIHGFCQRLLYENVFETGSAFDAEMLEDQTPLLTGVVEDFWRRSICDQPAEFLRWARAELANPVDLVQWVQASISAEVAVTPRQEGPGLRPETLVAFRNGVEDLRRCWVAGREEVRRILLGASLNAKSFGRVPAEKTGQSGRREQIVQGLLDALDAYISQSLPLFPPAGAVAKLSASNLAGVTLGHRPAPSHAVFDACEALQQSSRSLAVQMRAHLIYLKSQLLGVSKVELERRKLEKGVLAFDDLLRRVARALESPSGDDLAGRVRQRFRAALVDEFQDTDDLQYAVFSRLFSTPQHLLIMIGDPKQAIYGFRGADIFSYLAAARDAEARFTLDRNWRSTDGLVRALNTLFSRSAAPFLFPAIQFTPAQAAQGHEADGLPMTIWYLDSRQHREDGKALTKPLAQSLIARAVTAEIQRLIGLRRQPVAAGDIAVLVRTNRQASLMKDHLSAAGVPSVVYSTANVFESSEARELLSVLAGIAEPQSTLRLKSAMATHLLGATAADIAAVERDAAGIQSRIRRHGEYLRLWSSRGFAPMFRQFLKSEKVKPRMMALPNGERRLTNLLHLAERIHQAAEGQNTGVAGLVKWLERQIVSQAQASEEDQLRLESDALAVKIVTVHRSKGLEYPVVFCPFAWSGSAMRRGDFFFHDPQSGLRLTVDLSGELQSPNRILSQNESLAENLRLLYVALTRAKKRCYLAWGRINTAETSGLAYLLRERSDGPAFSEDTDWIERLKSEYGAIGDDELRARLVELADASGGTIAIKPLPVLASARAPEAAPPAVRLACREFKGNIDHTWSLTSYSGLVSAASVDTPDRDAAGFLPDREATWGDFQPSSAEDLFGFPAGARAGIFFHSLLEALDFTTSEPQSLVKSKLKEFGIDPAWEGPICTMLADVCALPMFAPVSDLRLADIRRSQMMAEMEFYFPLKLVTPALLREVFGRNRGPMAGAESLFPETIERLHFAPSRGYMKGFIDLVFEHQGRFYLIDWKSNRLGPTFEDYHRRRLAGAMAEHFYHLQYHLYTVALHQYLRQRIPGYDYDRNFGGVCYVFLRGLSSGRGPEYGLFHDRPAPALVQALTEALIAPNG